MNVKYITPKGTHTDHKLNPKDHTLLILESLELLAQSLWVEGTQYLLNLIVSSLRWFQNEIYKILKA